MKTKQKVWYNVDNKSFVQIFFLLLFNPVFKKKRFMHIQCWRVNRRTVQLGRRSILFIVVRRIRQCTVLPVMTVYFNIPLVEVIINVLTCNAVDRRFENPSGQPKNPSGQTKNPSGQTRSGISCFSAKTGH